MVPWIVPSTRIVGAPDTSILDSLMLDLDPLTPTCSRRDHELNFQKQLDSIHRCAEDYAECLNSA
ncbi:hypothetical protein BKA67DRAFT_578868 [Truncatella angustata]|uniref:Uncharacterized protein n=1 Tax=Truncatella angustata TaxID=152316 RepID=A0A9P8RKU4_9PEZI|nr:uncharacterized protein BKA67DRAFT_578868 [Truncatella angustata]KAH6647906.1 hypothetical protein BKA67DRAFT_578868 [Truncatella angustata]